MGGLINKTLAKWLVQKRLVEIETVATNRCELHLRSLGLGWKLVGRALWCNLANKRMCPKISKNENVHKSDVVVGLAFLVGQTRMQPTNLIFHSFFLSLSDSYAVNHVKISWCVYNKNTENNFPPTHKYLRKKPK